jgi:hypothetical protein
MNAVVELRREEALQAAAAAADAAVDRGPLHGQVRPAELTTAPPFETHP